MAPRKPSTPTPAKSPGPVSVVAEMPVTRAMLLGVRDELRGRIDETNARIDVINAHLAQVDARFAQVDAHIESVRRSLSAEIQHLATLIEEQEARNRVALEAVQGQTQRLDRLEQGQNELRTMVEDLVSLVRAPLQRRG